MQYCHHSKSPRHPHAGTACSWRMASGYARRLRVEQLEDRRMMAVLTVNSAADNTLADGLITLREAILAANNDTVADATEGVQAGSGDDTILFDTNVFSGGSASLIRLTAGELEITETLTIDGSAVTGIVISGDANDNDVLLPGTQITDVTLSSVANLLSDNTRVFNYSSSSGDLLLDNLTITGGRTSSAAENGAGIRFISSNGYNNNGTGLTVSNSMVRGNSATNSADGGGIFTGFGTATLISSSVSDNSSAAQGGGIFTVYGDVSLTDSTIADNNSGNDGGGIYTLFGEVTLTNSAVRGNRATGNFVLGGGIFANAEVTLTDSTVSDNSATGSEAQGGGIYAKNEVTLINSTVSGNSAIGSVALGGGIFAAGTATLTSSTVSDNSASGDGAQGGGIFASDVMTLTDSTINRNAAAGTGGGIVVADGDTNPSLTIENSVVAGNFDNQSAGTSGTPSDLVPDPDSVLTVNDSLIGVADGLTITGTNNLSGTAASPLDPLLGPLAENGGPTRTQALLPGSPALDAGSSSETYDQRGENRNFGGGADIGAYEAQSQPTANFVDDGVNNTGRVDGLDFLAWQLGFGKSNAVRSDGDSDGDGDVDGSDLAAWKVSYGQVNVAAVESDSALPTPPDVAAAATAPEQSPVRDTSTTIGETLAVIIAAPVSDRQAELSDAGDMAAQPVAYGPVNVIESVNPLPRPPDVAAAATAPERSLVRGTSPTIGETPVSDRQAELIDAALAYSLAGDEDKEALLAEAAGPVEEIDAVFTRNDPLAAPPSPANISLSSAARAAEPTSAPWLVESLLQDALGGFESDLFE